MKVFIIGLPKSGRTTVAKALNKEVPDSCYVSAFDWLLSTFREANPKETSEEYRLAFFDFVNTRLILNPYLLIDNLYDVIDVNKKEASKFIIDGLNSPKDFIHLFNYNEDMVVFLNRTNGPDYIEGFDQIAVNVIRDYCLWLASRNLLQKTSWLEFNFPIPGDASDDFTKSLGQKNTVTITRSINKTIELIKSALCLT